MAKSKAKLRKFKHQDEEEEYTTDYTKVKKKKYRESDVSDDDLLADDFINNPNRRG